MSAATKNKNLEIEFLRGMAVLLTALSHLPILLPFYDGLFTRIYFTEFNPWTGVDLFFCISGYVVSKAYMDVFDQRRQQGLYWLAVQNFFIRRVYRLLPTAWLWAILGLICSIFFNRTGVFATWLDNVRSITAIVTFCGNLANQYGMLLRPNSIYWSLALEEQFYVLFPIFLFMISSVRMRWRLLLLLIAAQFFIGRNPFGSPSEGMAYSFRLDAIMWGVLIYIFSRSPLYRHFEPLFLRSKPAACFVALVLFYLLVAIPGQLIKVPISVGMIAIVTALLVFMASFNKGYVVRLPIISPLMVWLGARSYGVYLIHIFTYRLVFEAFFRYTNGLQVPLDASFTAPLVVSSIVLTLFLAELNYRLVETPLRNLGVAITKRREAQTLEALPSAPV
jgi:peptidoglycan/LPS O-acetylase OafA/YrhL